MREMCPMASDGECAADTEEAGEMGYYERVG